MSKEYPALLKRFTIRFKRLEKFGFPINFYEVCINGDPWLTLTILWQDQIWLHRLFYEKVKTVDFSETITACDLKDGRCRQLFELMKVCEY